MDAEEKGLRETLEALIREESWRPMEVGGLDDGGLHPFSKL